MTALRLLVLGGTRNVGHAIVLEALARGHRVAVANRGRTKDELPAEVERIRADRRAPGALGAAVGGRDWDAVIDMTTYDARDAEGAIGALDGRTGCHVMISSGQVYLVREGAPAIATEADFEGDLAPEPTPGSLDHEEWKYGVDKREAELALERAWHARGFPSVRLRVPMIHGERDHHGRLHGYLARLADGAPLIVPSEPGRPIRQIDARDVVRVALDVAERRAGLGGAWNLAQPDTCSLADVLALLARAADLRLHVATVPRAELDRAGLLPSCSPLSTRWMSALDASLAARELGFVATPMSAYVPRIVADWIARGRPAPEGYAQRPAELAIIAR